MQFKDSTNEAERDHYDRRLRLEIRVHY